MGVLYISMLLVWRSRTDLEYFVVGILQFDDGERDMIKIPHCCSPWLAGCRYRTLIGNQV